MSSSLLPKSILEVAQTCKASSTRAAAPRARGLARGAARSFSTTTPNEARTLQRRVMFKWLNGPGEKLREALPGSNSNYLGAWNKDGELKRAKNAKEDGQIPSARESDLRPFTLNRNFVSQPITSEELREAVWRGIMIEGLSVKEVSALYRVEMSRVGAIVRLKEIEKEWLKQGKRLAKPYARAINSIVPQHEEGSEFESINDLPVHQATTQQIFWPTAESRQFNREDAAKVFDDNLLPADARVPHPELILAAKEQIAGLGPKERAALADARAKAENEKKYAADMRKMKKEAAAVKTVEGKRWDFKFRDIKVDEAGADGRGSRGVGWRYGVPLRDRKRGEVKIPTSV